MKRSSMVAFFRPAIVLMNRLKYPQKFLLIGLLLLLPLILALSQFGVQVDKDINFAANEQSGVVYITPLADFLKSVEEYISIQVAVTGGSSDPYSDQLTAKKAEIYDHIKAVDTVDQQLGAKFAVRQEWQS